MIRYTLLWIDDRKKDGFIDEADLSGFEIVHFSNSEEGMHYLELNPSSIDGVILDAKVYKNLEAEKVDDDNLSGMLNSIKIIERLEERFNKVIPKVVYTGQGDLLSDDEFEKTYDFIKIYSKADDSDELFDYLRSEILNSPEAQLKAQYSAVYKACSGRLLGVELWAELSPLLKHLNGDTPVVEVQQFNALRLIVDQVFITLKKYGVVPPALFPRDCPKLTMISKFLSGSEISEHDMPYMKMSSPVYGRLMSEQVRLLLQVVQAGSHRRAGDEKEKDIGLDTYRSEVDDTRLIKTLTLITIDLISWMVKFTENNPVKEENEKLWSCLDQAEMSAGNLCDGEIISSDGFGNLYVKPDLGQGVTMNIRIHSSEARRLELAKGDRVNLASLEMDGRTYRKAVEPISKL